MPSNTGISGSNHFSRWKNGAAFDRLHSQAQRFKGAVLIVAVVLFLLLWLGQRTASLNQFDQAVLRSLRSANNPEEAIGPAWLKEAVRDITAFGSVTGLVLISSAVAGFLALKRRFQAFALLVGALLGAFLINYSLKGLIARPRPSVVSHLVFVESPSFPSGHSLLATVVYLTLAAIVVQLLKEFKTRLFIVTLAVLLSLMVGMSRIFLGVHYPSDVVAGWAVGAAWASCCSMLAENLQRRGQVEPPAG